MGMEIYLLPAGIALIAAAVWTVASKGVLSRSIKTPQTTPVSSSSSPETTTEPSPTSALVVQPTPVVEESTTAPVQNVEPVQVETSTPSLPVVAIASAALVEAPAPFDEPQTGFTNHAVTSTTAMPTDTTAVSNIASPVESVATAPTLVIAAPKRRRVKKAPTDGAPKRKRMPRAKKTTVLPGTDTTAIPEVAAVPTVPAVDSSVTTAGQQSETATQIIKE